MLDLPVAAESLEQTPEVLPVIVEQVGDDTPPLAYTNTEDKTYFEHLPDSLEDTGLLDERGTVTTKTEGGAEEVDGQKLSGSLPPDLADTEDPAKLQIKDEGDLIAEIESILGKVREQYSKNGVSEGEGESSPAQSISEFLKLSTAQMENETVEEDPVIDQARKQYMYIWNQEAERLNAPYMRVTKAWPELGIVYMPDVTDVTDKIKASAAVKEAAATFKRVYEGRVKEADDTKATAEPLLKVLNNFMGAWLWAENADEATAAGLTDGGNSEEQPDTKTNTARSKGEKRLQVEGNPLLDNNLLSGLESQLNEMYHNIFTQPPPQPQPSHVTKSEDIIKTLSSGKLMLSCSVVPGSDGSLSDTIPNNPISNIPPNNPVADIRPIIDPFGVLDSIPGTPYGPQTAAQDRLRSPVGVQRPFPNPSGVLSPQRGHTSGNRAFNRPLPRPFTYSGPYLTPEVDFRPVGLQEASAPLPERRDYNTHPITPEDDEMQPIESGEMFDGLYAPPQPWRQTSWLY